MINGEKTEFMTMFSANNDDNEAKLDIKDNKGNIVHQKRNMKVLSYTVNKQNNMDVQMCSLTGKVTNSYIKIKGAIPFMNDRNKKDYTRG